MVFAYSRVSSKEQNEARQLIAFKVYEPTLEDKNIYIDKESGKDFDRTQYKELLKVLRSGDTLLIKELDRFGRNKLETKENLQFMEKLGVRVKIFDIPTTMTDFPPDNKWVQMMISNLMIEVLGSIAEQERIKIRQRQAEGISALRARNNGKGIGRPKADIPEDFQKKYRKFKKGEYGDMTALGFAKMMGMGRSTIYKYIKELESK
jgi:DNA invertase Pin-like site-specific DNA recombinase